MNRNIDASMNTLKLNVICVHRKAGHSDHSHRLLVSSTLSEYGYAHPDTVRSTMRSEHFVQLSAWVAYVQHTKSSVIYHMVNVNTCLVHVIGMSS